MLVVDELFTEEELLELDLAEMESDDKARPAPEAWEDRIKAMLPDHFIYPFSQPHIELWEWADEIERESAPDPFVALWARNRGKSTNAEAIAIDLGARGKRLYCWYVSETQDQADKHVVSIRMGMESDGVHQFYPEVGTPKVTKTGGRLWRRNLLLSGNDFAVEAIGLDKAIRGGKIESQRPDLIIFDDIDAKHDTENAVTKKEGTITTSILPAGSHNCAVLFCQNLIHSESIASRLAKKPGTKGAADYLANRTISGPFPAVEGLDYEWRDGRGWVITKGTSLWRGFTLTVCEAEINREGPTAFSLESQHEVDTDNPYALLTEDDFNRTRVNAAPDLVRVAVAVDPPGGATACGIVAGGKVKHGEDWHGYILEDASTAKGVQPETWALATLQCYFRVKADVIFVERNYGGDMVANTIRQTKWRDADGNVIVDGAKVKVVEVNATRGKQVRAEPVATAYQQGRVHHVGHFAKMEKEWRQWVPGDKESPNRLDADVWLVTGLELIGQSNVEIQRQAANLYGSRNKSMPRGRRRR